MLIGRGGRVALRITLMIAAMGIAFAMLHRPVRQFEADTAVALLHALGVHGVFAAPGARIGVVPSNGAAFQALVTTSCSSLSAILAVLCLGSAIPGARRRNRALAAALTVILAGNIVRITASVAIGSVAGRSSLVLFHDWVGSVFALSYTIGGYVLLLWLLLPAEAASPTPREVAVR